MLSKTKITKNFESKSQRGNSTKNYELISFYKKKGNCTDTIASPYFAELVNPTPQKYNTMASLEQQLQHVLPKLAKELVTYALTWTQDNYKKQQWEGQGLEA